VTASLTSFTVISCCAPGCTKQYVGDLRFDLVSVRTARVPIIDRALAAAGWITVGNETICPACADRLLAIAERRGELAEVESQLRTARSVRACLQGIEVG
jgi:hypothetical protein